MKPQQDFLTANLNGLPDLAGPHLDGAEPVAWRDATHSYIPTCTWSRLFSGGQSQKAGKALIDMQLLMPGGSGRFTRKAPRAVPGRPWLYCVSIDRVMAYKAG
jgi:hypothetical protein